MEEVRTRFAPSPTGFLHVGSIYSALLDFAYARKHHGKFIVRLEDTDLKRVVKGTEELIYEGLSWMGISPDESPKIGGPYGPYRQSERLSLYQKYAHELAEKGFAYHCFCPFERLVRVRKEREARGLPPMYDKRCRRLSKKKAEKRVEAGEKYVVRLKVPEKEKIVVPEPIRGEIVFESKVVDDQILLKSDGFPTYHLAVVVDDYLMKITHAFRGEEWLSSAPKHFLLYRFFGWQAPIYIHTPIIRNPDRSKLSKRYGHTSLSWYREQGFLSEALRNFLFLLGWSHPKQKEIFSLEEFIKYFDYPDLSPVGPVFDLQKLEWMNGVYIRQKRDKDLVRLIKRFVSRGVPVSFINKTIPLVKERLTKLSDYTAWVGFFFEEPKVEKNLFDKQAKEQLTKALMALKEIKNWQKEEIEKVLSRLVERESWSMGNFFMNFRIAITGSKITPPITDSAALLGQKETLNRLQNCLKLW